MFDDVLVDNKNIDLDPIEVQINISSRRRWWMRKIVEILTPQFFSLSVT